MKVAITIVTLLISLLSFAAGAAKIALMPDEVRFLGQFGFNPALVVTFGVAQVLGGLLLVVPATRAYGAIVAGIAFALSALLLLIGGNFVFAGISLIPVCLAGLVGFRSYANQTASELREGDA